MSLKTQGTELFYLSADDTMTKVGKITGVTGTGGGASKIDVTDLDSTEKESIAGLPDPGAASVPINFDPSNPEHQDLFDLYTSGDKKTWVVGFADGSAPPTAAAGVITYPTTRTYMTFSGYIADLPIDAALDSKVETTMTVQRSGPRAMSWKA